MKKLGFLVFFALLFKLNMYAQEPYDSLLLHYPFTNNTVDLSGQNNRGVIHGASLTKDRFNRDYNAYEFDGIEDYIEFNPDDLLQPYYSYSLWTFPYSIPSDGSFSVLISIGDPSNGADHGIAIANNYSTGKMNGWTIWGYADNGLANTIPQNVLPEDSTWYHIVMVRDINDIKLYINGEFINNRIIEGDAIYGVINSATIGKRNSINQNYHGKIDDVRIYNRPLDSDEIFNLYSENIYYEYLDTLTRTIYDSISISVTDTLIIDVTITSIDPPDNSNTLKVFPNPAKDILYIDAGDKFEQMTDYQIKIINIEGFVIFESNVSQQLFKIDVSDFGQTGLYFIQIIDNSSQIIDVKKILLE